jgi:hypothetical protein
MHIHPDFMDGTIFLCVDAGKGTVQRKPCATGFIVEVEDENNPSLRFHYVVTARHNLEEHPFQDIYVRINRAEGGLSSENNYEDIPTRKSQWTKHQKADVAAVLLPTLEASLRYRPIKLEWFVDVDYKFRPRGDAFDQRLVRNAALGLDVSQGDEFFVTGLFVQSAGNLQNLPICRFGHISRMPHKEMVGLETRNGRIDVVAYLAECHSWGGHSGSPAFWHWEYDDASFIRGADGHVVQVLTTRRWLHAFLGLVSAHYDIEQTAKDKSDIVTKLNAGIAVITPAHNVKELLLEDEDLVAERKARSLAIRNQQPLVTADFALVNEAKQVTQTSDPENRTKIPIVTRNKSFGDSKKSKRKQEKK